MTFHPKSATVLRGDYAWAQYAPHPALAPWVSHFLAPAGRQRVRRRDPARRRRSRTRWALDVFLSDRLLNRALDPRLSAALQSSFPK
jgi:hypothetical protein